MFVRAYTSAGPGPYTQPRVLEISEYNHDVLVHMLVHVMHVEFREGLQHAGFAKEVLSDSLRLVDFPVGLMDSVLHFPDSQVKFLGKIFLENPNYRDNSWSYSE